MAPIYWMMAHFHRLPGLYVQRYLFFMVLYLLLVRRKDIRFIFPLLVFPLDSVRYFEFDSMWQSLKHHAPTGSYLDISSPRLFPAFLMYKFSTLKATLINPDSKDLEVTRSLMDACGVGERCRYFCQPVGDFDGQNDQFDTITCISVIEHIPADGDTLAVKKMWSLLKPGGRLFLSVPCAKEAFIEYMDFHEYGLLREDSNGFFFGQQFFDVPLLQKRIYNITGNPVRYSICGEKKAGSFILNRAQKASDTAYPLWREPYTTALDYRWFDSVSDLPGWGVISMEFLKR